MTYQEKLEQLGEAKNLKNPIDKNKCYFCSKKKSRQLLVEYYGGAVREVPVCSGHIRAKKALDEKNYKEIKEVN